MVVNEGTVENLKVGDKIRWRLGERAFYVYFSHLLPSTIFRVDDVSPPRLWIIVDECNEAGVSSDIIMQWSTHISPFDAWETVDSHWTRHWIGD